WGAASGLPAGRSAQAARPTSSSGRNSRRIRRSGQRVGRMMPAAARREKPRRSRPACTAGARRLRHAGRMSRPAPASPDAPAHAGSVIRRVRRFFGSEERVLDDHIAEEVPVAFVYNDEPFAVMMATPADLVDFAKGFALSEGIVDSAADVAIEHIEHLIEGIQVRLRIPSARAQALEHRRRSMSGRSGCGICGSELLEAALRWPAPVQAQPRVAVAALRRALRELKSSQAINARTGATHAAGWAALDGTLQLAREDVGR